jgi:predicted negative regulator of RcsB-dependent stress response
VALSTEEEESIESLKRWWNESGRLLALGIAVVVIGYFGWQFWQNSQTQNAARASAIYDQLTRITVTAPGQAVEEPARSEALALIESLKSDHTSSIYALYGALFGARLAVEADDLATARTELEWFLANTRSGLLGSTEETLVSLAQLRLGRVLLADNQPDRALSVISSVDGKALTAQFEELRGDIYLAQGQRDLAVQAYAAAVAAGDGNPVLQMKLNELQGSL